MSRHTKFISLSMLVLFILACNTVTQPVKDAQNLAGTVESIATAMPIETLKSLTTQVPVETLQALPSMAPSLEALASAMPDFGDIFDPQGTPVSEWNGIPVMPQATSGQDFPDSKTYSFKANITVKEADEFYKTELEKLGWTSYITMPADANGSVQVFQKDNNVLTITSLDKDGTVVVVLVLA